MKYDLAGKANQDKKRYAQLKEMHINDFIDNKTQGKQLSCLFKVNGVFIP
jgi:hypothetical protein